MTIAEATSDGPSEPLLRPRVTYPLVIGLALAVTVCVAYGVLSVRVRTGDWWSPRESPDHRQWWLRHATECGTEAVIAAWLFVVGGCLGSFLNVVVHRLPRGDTLLGHSQCPSCRARIRARDNIPVWGWIRRGGRCFRCGLPISVRYPTVELTVAYLCLMLAILEIPLQGVHLFGSLQIRHVGFVTTLLEGQLEGAGRFAVHATLLAIVLAAAWIRFNGQRIPWGLVVCGLVVTITMTALLPATRAWQPMSLHLTGGRVVQWTVWLNLLGGALIGAAWWSLWRRDGFGSLGLDLYVGATLGIAAGAVAFLLTRVLCPRPATERSATPPGPLWVATTLVLSTWWLVSLRGVDKRQSKT